MNFSLFVNNENMLITFGGGGVLVEVGLLLTVLDRIYLYVYCAILPLIKTYLMIKSNFPV